VSGGYLSYWVWRRFLTESGLVSMTSMASRPTFTPDTSSTVEDLVTMVEETAIAEVRDNEVRALPALEFSVVRA